MNTPETRAQQRHLEQAGTVGEYLQTLKTNPVWALTARRVTRQYAMQAYRNRIIREALDRDLTADELAAVNECAERLYNHESPRLVFDDFVDWAARIPDDEAAVIALLISQTARPFPTQQTPMLKWQAKGFNVDGSPISWEATEPMTGGDTVWIIATDRDGLGYDVIEMDRNENSYEEHGEYSDLATAMRIIRAERKDRS